MMLDIELDESQAQIVESIRRVLPRLSSGVHSPTPIHDLSDVAELGTFLLGVAEDAGGIGFSSLEEIVAYRELGRACVDPTFLAQTSAVHLAVEFGRKDLVAIFGDGSSSVSVAPRIALAGWAESIDVHANSSVNYLVNSGGSEGWILANNGKTLRLIPASAVQDRQPLIATNDHLKLERVILPNAVLGEISTNNAFQRLRIILLATAMLVGVSEAARDMAVEYSKIRKQFDDFIGAFQAIKHKCADMALRSEAAWCQTVHAAFELRDGGENPSAGIFAAAHLALRAAKRNSEENIQVHGGIGFTEECGAHVLLKQALAVEQLWLASIRSDLAEG